jgi:exocyst complex protein 7
VLYGEGTGEHGSRGGGDSSSASNGGSTDAAAASATARAALAAAVSRLLARLLDNLEAKSRSYRGEPALSALFMMNNVHYVQWSVEGSTAEELLGRDWLERHKDLVEDWGARYQDVTWGPVLALLQVGTVTRIGCMGAAIVDPLCMRRRKTRREGTAVAPLKGECKTKRV